MPMETNAKGVGRRRSSSESQGDHLSSTINPVNYNVPLITPNTDRCLSQPNISGFIDDTYRANAGTRLQTRRAVGGSNIENEIRTKRDFENIEDRIISWENEATNSVQSLDVIEYKHNLFCTEIDKLRSNALMGRVDFCMIGDLGILKSRLDAIRKDARRLFRANRETAVNSNFRNDDVFTPNPRVNSTPPNELDLSVIRSPTIPNNVESIMTLNQNSRIDIDLVRSNDLTVRGEPDKECEPVMRGEGSTLSLDFSKSLTSILASLGNLKNDPRPGFQVISTCTDTWRGETNSKYARLDSRVQEIERSLGVLSKSIVEKDKTQDEIKLRIGELDKTLNEIKSRIDQQDTRYSTLDVAICTLRTAINDRINQVETWFNDIRAMNSSDVPKEIVDSIQEVILDSAPGIAVETMRNEVRDMRKAALTDRFITEGLRDMVVTLKEQVESQSNIVGANLMNTNSSAVSEGTLREREIVKKGIERLEKQILQSIQIVIPSNPIDISLVKKCKTVDVPSIHTAVGNIQKYLQKYVNFPGMDSVYCDNINDLMDRAETWCLNTERLYNLAEVHSINTSKGDTSDVGVFSDNSEVTVYEFLETAEIAYLGWGNSVQKANRLYNRHLSEEIKGKLINKSDSYTEMKQWLISQYGGASRIVNDIVNALGRKPKPALNNRNEKHNYYTAITSALQRLERLAKVSSINKIELDICLYSQGTLITLSNLLLPRDYDNWVRKMTSRNLDFNNPAGEETFRCFQSVCIAERNITEASRNQEKVLSPKPKPKNKNVFKARHAPDSSSDEEPSNSIHATSYHNKQWYPTSLKFPCPIGNHKHEMSTCAEFFAFSPVERWNKMDKGKVCYCCLLPKNVCIPKKCTNEAGVPNSLKCQECKTWADGMGLAPLSVLFCRKKEHANSRVAFSIIKKDLETYIGKFGTSVVDSSIKFAVNYTYQVHSMIPSSANALACSKDVSKLGPAPTIDSETGMRVKVPSANIVPEISEHSCYLMQTLAIGSSEVLVFFDTGANIHLIDGNLAELEKLQLVSSKPTALTVVGGDRVKTSFGSYRFNLGPGEGDVYHEIICAGMDSVTSGFMKYDIQEICEEYQKYSVGEEKNFPLPKTVGGAQVQLLLGIKNTDLNPIFIKKLPSGIGVYLSPFKDIYGSRIIFAGPHRIFTEGNKGFHAEFSNAIFLLREQTISELIDEEQVESRFHSFVTHKALGTTIHPYAINDDDIKDVGGLIPEQFEDRIDDQDEFCRIMDHGAHLCGVHKATVPIARMREMLDIDDTDDTITFRCEECSKCSTCKTSARRTAVSLQEAREQQYIERSVKVDLESNSVTVTYPFLKEPVEFLSARHHHTDNYQQAVKVYKSQCRKSETVKEGMRLVHRELVEKGFMVKISELNKETQDFIMSAGFRHYHPWRLVMKTDSVTTPVRMVVDPTMSFLNLILAKGENRLGFIFDIIIRNRIMWYAWSSDISKLYNQLILDLSALPYSLFLFKESLDAQEDPEIWVMVRAWYGVCSTGGQAGYAIDKLVSLLEKQHPEAVIPLKSNRYVDDLLSGSHTREGREKEIDAVRAVLKKGGFALKFVVRSGEKPSEKASSDGESMKMLGYKWDTEKDVLSPGTGELNLNKKSRGEKKPNPFPIKNQDDAEKLLRDVKVTRRMVLGKVSELWDPCGFFEPLKLQLKLEMLPLSGIEWDAVLADEIQEPWKNIFKDFVDYHQISIPRCCLSKPLQTGEKLRLICLSDAAETAGGAAVYIGQKLDSGNWSCQLLAAKSKMLSATIPRNELSAILLCTELAFMVKRALGDVIGEILYVTDSTIALSWCHNSNIKLRLFVYNRVMTILRMCEWTTGTKEIPLYHIDGSLNLSDLLTKKHAVKVEDVSAGSVWIEGLDWMTRDTEDMPLTPYTQLRVGKPIEDEVKVECFSEPFIKDIENGTGEITPLQIISDPGVHAVGCSPPGGRGEVELIIDPVYHGWRRSLRILGYVRAIWDRFNHKNHLIPIIECDICRLGVTVWDPRTNEDAGESYFFRYETQVIKRTVKPKLLEMFQEDQGILYDHGRLSAEFQFKTQDVDGPEYIDKHEILEKTPVVLVDSPILYSYLMYIHTIILPHAGVEITIKQITLKMRVFKGLRNLVKKVCSDCIKCRLIEKRSLELKMSQHPEARTILAPPFTHCMMDIAFGFKGQAYKRARMGIKVYALVIVCILSGATNILAVEGLECQDVISGIERHASRYGVPATLFVDSGTQLKALKHASCSVRDIEAQIQDSLGIRIVVSNAKAHEERGRVERRIRTLRETLEKLGIQNSLPMTSIQWDCLFAKISNTMNNLPIARGDTSNASKLGYEIITPNRLVMGRNNFRSLEGSGVFLEMSSNYTRILERNRHIYNSWFQGFIDNIHLLDLRPKKWLKSSRFPVINDIVLFVFNDGGYSKESTVWRLGKISKIGKRNVTVEYYIGDSKSSTLVERSIRDISIVYSVGELMINTNDHFKKCNDPGKV